MASRNSIREMHTFILSDRVAPLGAYGGREWGTADTLFTLFHHKGWKGLEQNVLVVANCPEHLGPLSAVAASMVAWGLVDERDWGPFPDTYRQKAALRAGRIHANAMSELSDALEQEIIDPLVCGKLMHLLHKRRPDRVDFMKNWEYALPYFSAITLAQLQSFKHELVAAYFGDVEISGSVRRKDAQRGRVVMKDPHHQTHGPGNAPRTNAIEIGRKYLTSVLPHLMPNLVIEKALNMAELIPVTERPQPITPVAVKSAHEKNRQSVSPRSLTSLPAGFFDGQRSDCQVSG